MSRPRARRGGFALLPVMLILAMLGVLAALLFERGGLEDALGAAERRSTRLTYAAEAGFSHAKALLGRQGGCSGLPTLPSTPFDAFEYSAELTMTTTAPGTTYALPVVADSWIGTADPAALNGTVKDMRVRAKVGDDRHAVVQFDMASLPPNLDIASATLRLYVKNEDPSGSPIEVYRITSPWSEATVSWSSSGTSYDAALLDASFYPTAVGPIALDVTRLVREWAAGGVPNYGVRLVATSNDEESVYATREEGDATRHPRLDVVTRPRIQVAVDAQAVDAAGIVRQKAGVARGPADGALFLDYFNAAYAGNDGTRGWSGDWREIGESNGPSSGAVDVAAGSRCAHGSCLRIDGGLLLSTTGAWRELNLAGADAATLRLDTRRNGGNWTLQVSANGGGTWDTLKSVGAGSDGKQVRDVFDVSPWAASDTRIRITTSQILGLGVKEVYVDNVEVEAFCGP